MCVYIHIYIYIYMKYPQLAQNITKRSERNNKSFRYKARKFSYQVLISCNNNNNNNNNCGTNKYKLTELSPTTNQTL